MFEPVLNESIIGRAQKSGAIEIVCHQLRDYAFDKHRRVDDTPYGGGMGMLMKAEPIALCFENICKQTGKKPHFVYMSPQGKTLTQKRLRETIFILIGNILPEMCQCNHIIKRIGFSQKGIVVLFIEFTQCLCGGALYSHFCTSEVHVTSKKLIHRSPVDRMENLFRKFL